MSLQETKIDSRDTGADEEYASATVGGLWRWGPWFRHLIYGCPIETLGRPIPRRCYGRQHECPACGRLHDEKAVDAVDY